MSHQHHFLRLGKPIFLVIFVLFLLFGLLPLAEQINVLRPRQMLAAANWPTSPKDSLIDCPGANSQMKRLATPLPETRYYYSDTYGWFDVTHFSTGNPAQLIADLELAVQDGGGVLKISQGVRDGVTGYTAYYMISGNVAAEEIVGVALGIYMDWSIRFEGWQGEIPRSLVGPFTSYSIEDLPSQYLGFFAAAKNLEMEQLFACYLGHVEGSENPPHLQVVDEQTTDAIIELPAVERLTNEGFQPMVWRGEAWQIVNWPAALYLAPIPGSGQTWFFAAEKTWYLDQGEPE